MIGVAIRYSCHHSVDQQHEAMRKMQATLDEQTLRGPSDPNEFRRLVVENDTLRKRLAAMQEGVDVEAGEEVGALICLEISIFVLRSLDSFFLFVLTYQYLF